MVLLAAVAALAVTQLARCGPSPPTPRAPYLASKLSECAYGSICDIMVGIPFESYAADCALHHHRHLRVFPAV